LEIKAIISICGWGRKDETTGLYYVRGVIVSAGYTYPAYTFDTPISKTLLVSPFFTLEESAELRY
jgi:hypothetical protein